MAALHAVCLLVHYLFLHRIKKINISYDKYLKKFEYNGHIYLVCLNGPKFYIFPYQRLPIVSIINSVICNILEHYLKTNTAGHQIYKYRK